MYTISTVTAGIILYLVGVVIGTIVGYKKLRKIQQHEQTSQAVKDAFGIAFAEYGICWYTTAVAYMTDVAARFILRFEQGKKEEPVDDI